MAPTLRDLRGPRLSSRRHARPGIDTLLRDQHFEHDVVSPEAADWRLEDWLQAASGVDVDRWVRRAVEREKVEGLGESNFDLDEPIEPVDRDDERSGGLS